MTKMKKKLYSLLLGVLALFTLMLGMVFAMPTQKASAATTMSTSNWSLAVEGASSIRIQNGTEYWTAYTNGVTTASILDYAEINGKTLSEINAEKPGAVSATLQPAGGSIGSFFRVNIDSAVAGFTPQDIATFVVRAGWSHTDSSGTYTIDSDLYFAHIQNTQSQSDTWKYIPASNVVDISDNIVISSQGSLHPNSETILVKTGLNAWGNNPATPNEGGGTFLNTLYVNGTSIKEWNNKAQAMLANGEISDITFGCPQGNIQSGAPYAPIVTLNSNPGGDLGSIFQTWVPTGYINGISSFKVGKGFANLQGDTLYYVSKDVEYVKSGSEFVKVVSSVDISDAFKILAQDHTASNGTMLYYLHTDNVNYWTENYGSAGAYAINEKEWKGQATSSLQGGAVQMSYLEFNGTSVYDINANDNGAYGATQGNIASGGKYAPILAFITPTELGNAIKLQVPSAYPSGSGVAADNHHTITIKKGFYVVDTATNIKYEVTRDIQWDYENGAWSVHTNKIEASVDEIKMFGSASDAFAGISLVGDGFEKAPGTYAGDAKTAKSFAQSANFKNYVLIDDQPLKTPGEAFLNVWGNYGYFTFRPGNNNATKITVLKGCQIPTYNALLNGANEVYITTEDVTFVKNADGNWVKDEGVRVYNVTFTVDSATYHTAEVEEGNTVSAPAAPTKAASDKCTYEFMYWALNGAEFDFNTQITGETTLNAVFKEILKAGEYDTSVSKVVYARNNASNWLMLTLSDKDYPKSDVEPNVQATEAQLAALNLYDKIIVDGYSLRSRIEKNGAPSTPGRINHWAADCLGLQVPGAGATLDGAQRVTIRAGAQFPSYAYITEGVGAYFVTTEEITFVNVGANDGKWVQEYQVTYVADGEVVGVSRYLKGESPEEPDVPVKTGYRGKWAAYTEGTASNITVKAVYTATEVEYKKTNISAVNFEEGFLILTLTKDDYVSAPSTWWGPNGSSVKDVLNAMKGMDFHVYGADGNEIKLGGDAIINIWGTEGYDLAFYLNGYGSANMPTKVSFKKGCEIPSYTLIANGEQLVYELEENVSFTKVDGVWVRDKEYVEGDFEMEHPADFQDHYILSDLAHGGNTKSYVFEDGIETLTDAEGEAAYRYGYMPSTSFLLSFDFKFTGDIQYYQTFNIQLGTEGYEGNKYHFGWRFYLLRGSAENGTTPNMCVEYFSNTRAIPENGNANIEAPSLGSSAFVKGQVYHITIGYKLLDAATGTVLIYTAINEYSVTKTYVLGGDFVKFAPYANSLSMNALTGGTVTVSNPNMDMTNTAPNRITLMNDNDVIERTPVASYVLPALNPSDYNKGGYVFVGWTDNTNLYPAGYKAEITADTTFHAVWYNFNMRDGASVRKVNGSGLRFLVNADYSTFNANDAYLEIGTIIAPTSYLGRKELTHELGAGYYLGIPTTQWQDEGANSWYSAVMLNISPDQYARSFSARGYLKVQYTTGEGYVYTEYNAAEHARSVYQVANAAYAAESLSGVAVVEEYINSVADITISEGLVATKTAGAQGNYNVSVTLNGNTIRIELDKKVKAAIINGERVMMGYDTRIMIGGVSYTLNGYDMSASGTTFEFTLEGDASAVTERYYRSILEGYANSEAYTSEHKAYINTLVANGLAALSTNDFAAAQSVVATLADVKTAAQLAANNTSKATLSAPVVSKGLGYTVTWSEVANADYYTIHDDNDYRAYTVVMAGAELSYKAEVVGNHNVYVKAHSFSQTLNSATSNTEATPEVKPVFSYKAMQDGLYKFSSSQMSTMGISTTGYYYDSSDKKYFAYYNKDFGWTPYPSQATDWSSPEEFPAHAQRLKDMGNNIIMINYDSNSMYKEGEVWESSRLKYIMDTAWSMGMKVLVCDQVLYKLSMSDNSGTGATSKSQVTTAINNSKGFKHYVTHPAFYGFSLDDEPYGKYISAMSYTISAIDDACEKLGVENPFYLACLFQAQGGEIGKEMYLTQSSLEEYYEKWLAIDGVDGQYLYVDIYTQHAMDQPTNRYNTSFEVVYSDSYLGGKYDFHQAITAHTQNDGVLLEQDLYMSLLYAAAHNVAGYSWFCYFPISGELAGSLAGFDGNGYGNGIGNNASGCYYNAAQRAAAQYELIQGWLDGYEWMTRNHNDSKNLLTTTLSNGTKTATMYVNADVDSMSGSVTVTASGSVCYLVGYGVGTAEAPYQIVSGSVPLAPGQAVLCIS